MSDIYFQNNDPNNAAALYGLETDFSNDSDPYKALGYKEDAISDIFKLANIYPEDLLGLPDAPEMPTEQPYQSDMMLAMGNNPLMAAIAQAISEGMDPQVAAEAAVIQAQDAQEGDPLFGAAEGMNSGDFERLGSTGMAYAQEMIRQNREQSAYDQQVSDYENWYNPQALDARDDDAQLTDLIEQYGIQRLRPDFVDPRVAEAEAAKARGVQTVLGEKMMDGEPDGAGWVNPDGSSGSRATGGPIKGAAPYGSVEQFIAPQATEWEYQEPVLGGVAGSTSRQGPIENEYAMPSAAAPPTRTGGGGGGGPFGDIGGLIESYAAKVAPGAGLDYGGLARGDQHTADILRQVAEIRRNTAQPSQQEMANRARLGQAYTMITGNPVPQKAGGYTPPPVVQRRRAEAFEG